MQLLYTRLTPSTPRSPLLLFFAGWGQSAATTGDIEMPGYDIALVWDYRSERFLSPQGSDITAETLQELHQREEIVVAAWSFGVNAAARFLASYPGLRVTARIAFNGSRFTVDSERGIPPAIFFSTLYNLNERNVERFEMRVWGGASAFRRGGARLSGRPVDELADELRCFATAEAPRLLWDKVYISDNDLIIPPAAQRKAWEGEAVEIITVDGAHRPDFNRLLARTLTDKSHVARRFGRARDTYDSNATPQLQAGRRLLSLTRDYLPEQVKTMIDIGCGTGALTSEAITLTAPRNVELWDLHIPASAAVLKENHPSTHLVFRETDAETAIASLDADSVDLIFSASTAQWFNSLRAFLENAYRALRRGGVIALSTYGPLTMRQIAEATGTVSRFMSVEAVGRAIPAGAEIMLLEEEINNVTFGSALEVMRHVSLTGVNALTRADRSEVGNARRVLSRYPLEPDGSALLTFQPIYLIIRKP